MVDVIQTVLELTGALLLVAAAALTVWPFAPPAALAVAGAGVLAVSAVIERRKRRAS